MKSNFIGIVALLVIGHCNPVWAVITGRYLFEEGTGSTALDSSTFGRNGTLTNGAASGGPTYTTGLYKNSNYALLFDSASKDRVALPQNQDFIRNAPGATLLAWVRFDANIDFGTGLFPTIAQVNTSNTADFNGYGASRAAITDSHNFGFRGVGSQLSEARASVNGAELNCRDSMDCPVVGETYFVAGVFDYVNRTIAIYSDGVLLRQNSNVATWNGGNSADAANLYATIGASPDPTASTTLAWKGAIDGVRIYNNALLPQEILDIYNAEVIVPILGDYNGNSIVDAADYVLWRRGSLSADGTGPGGTPDGIVDNLDYGFWRARFGNTSNPGSASTAAAVPEPTTWIMVTSLASLFLMRLRKRRDSM